MASNLVMRAGWWTILGWAAAVALAGAGAGRATESAPPAPPLELERVLAGPERIDLGELAGDAVLVDFWATWCAPCVAALPHWNQLVAEFAGEPVRFLSVSSESEETVRRFLEQRRFDGWLALDTDRSVFDAYGVVSIPRIALIDPEGRLRGTAYPEDLTAESIRELMASRTPELPERPDLARRLAVRLDAAGQPQAIFEISIRPSTGEEFVVRRSETSFVSLSARVEQALRMALGVPRSRIVLEAELPEQLHDFVFRVGSAELLNGLLEPALADAFDLKINREERLADVFVLRAPNAGEPQLGESAASSFFVRSTPEAVEFTGATMEEIVGALENLLGRPVVDESGLEGRYDLTLERAGEPLQIAARVQDETGLCLVAERRRVEMLVVRERGS